MPHGPFSMTALTSSSTSGNVRMCRIFLTIMANCNLDSSDVWPSTFICDQSSAFKRLKHEYLSIFGNCNETASTNFVWSSNDHDAR